MRTLEQFIVVLWDIAWVNSAVAPLGAPYIPCEHEELSAGNTVQVMLDPDLFRIAQEDHGGWNDRMAEVNIILMVKLVLICCINLKWYKSSWDDTQTNTLVTEAS